MYTYIYINIYIYIYNKNLYSPQEHYTCTLKKQDKSDEKDRTHLNRSLKPCPYNNF